MSSPRLDSTFGRLPWFLYAAPTLPETPLLTTRITIQAMSMKRRRSWHQPPRRAKAPAGWAAAGAGRSRFAVTGGSLLRRDRRHRRAELIGRPADVLSGYERGVTVGYVGTNTRRRPMSS